MKDLAGKLALVTGAARGTGAAIARRFAEHGTRVVLGDILHDEGERVAQEIGALARFVPHDVTDANAWNGIVAAALEAGGVRAADSSVLAAGVVAAAHGARQSGNRWGRGRA